MRSALSLSVFLVAVAAARGNELLNRWNTVPIDLLTSVFGTSENSLGGFELPLDSGLFTALSVFSPYYFRSRGATPLIRDSPECLAYYRVRPMWQGRYDSLLASERDGKQQDPSDPWVSLLDTPEQMGDLDEQGLECLLALGFTPTRIPLGQVYGRVNSVMSNPLILDIAQAVWGGKIVVKTRCDNGDALYVSCNQVGHGTGAFAHLSIGGPLRPERANLGVKVYENEVIDHGSWLWIDYGQNFTRVCEPEVPMHYTAAKHRGPLVGSAGHLMTPARLTAGAIFDNSWPTRLVVDQGRWVGRDKEQGMDIYLFRSMLLFPEGLRPVLWFNLKSGDLLDIEIA